MNRRGFMKLVALTPLAGLLKPVKVFSQKDIEAMSKALEKELTEKPGITYYDSRCDEPDVPTIRVVGEDQPPARIMFGYTPPTPFSYGPVFITQVAPVKN